MKKYLYRILLFIFSISSFNCFAQETTIFMDFRNQKISDIIYAVADVCGESVYVDETVTGTATFHFEDLNFESALNRFADYCQLYIEKKDGAYIISKVKITVNKDSKYSVSTENVEIEPFLNMLSRTTNTTILYDALPKASITIRVSDEELEDILNLTIVKLPGFALERVASGYYITKSSGANSRRNVDVFTISKVKDKYDISIQRASFSNILENLFKKAGLEYTLLSKNSIQLEGLNFTDKSFEELLNLLLDQACCDYSISNGVYYIFDIQRKDVLKKYKETKLIYLKNVSAEAVLSLIPSELSNSSFIKTDKDSNMIILNGSESEIKPIEDFISKIDVPNTGKYYKRFDVSNIKVSEAVSLMPKTLLDSEVYIVPGSEAFITLVTEEREKLINDFLIQLDIGSQTKEVFLKYIKSEELLRSLPPSVTKDNIIETIDPNFVFFKGSEALYKTFIQDLSRIDCPKQQIRYELLVIQRQKSSGVNIGSELSASSTTSDSGYSWNGKLSNIFNINFDIISQFGIQFAGKLNVELSEGKSHVLADTTLNGISGQVIKFENTSTTRYRDAIKDSNGDLYSTVVRDISTGLVLNINGWVSGEDMITVTVDAQVSKQVAADNSSNDTTALPSTSEKKVSTSVRTKSGEPVIIGGLFQTEVDISEKKVPFLGSIPIIGRLFTDSVESSSDTEFVIYLVPFVQKNETEVLSEEENLARLKEKYEIN